jgi:hypothetical protein
LLGGKVGGLAAIKQAVKGRFLIGSSLDPSPSSGEVLNKHKQFSTKYKPSRKIGEK